MKKQVEIEIATDGTMKMIYEDDVPDLATEMGAEVDAVCRASHVEFEEVDGRKGWTVRSAKDTELALRVVDWCRWAPVKTGTLVTFATRDEALQEEVKWFWNLLSGTEATACP